MIDITSYVAHNMTNENDTHEQNETVNNMTNITCWVAHNVANANNIHNHNKITLL